MAGRIKWCSDVPDAKIYYVRIPDPKNPSSKGIPILTVAVAPSLKGDGMVDRATALCLRTNNRGGRNPDYPPKKRKGRMIALGRLRSMRIRNYYRISRTPVRVFIDDVSRFRYCEDHIFVYGRIRYLINNNGLDLPPTEFEKKLLGMTNQKKEESNDTGENHG